MDRDLNEKDTLILCSFNEISVGNPWGYVDVLHVKARLALPTWVPAVRNLRTSSSFICRTLRVMDIV